MTYFHVRIERKSAPDKPEFVLDLGRDHLEQRFLAPYRSGAVIMVNGARVTASDLARIQVSSSDEDAETLGRRRQAEEDAYYSKLAQSGMVVMHSTPFNELVFDGGKDVTDELLADPVLPDGSPQSEPKNEVNQPADSKTVFVVHGRNEGVRRAMFEFLRSLGLRPLEWIQAINKTKTPAPYIGEVLDAAFAEAQAVLVLFTPDDEARLKDLYIESNDLPHERNLTGQARPNVLFEAGMAMGRAPNRTILVEFGDLRPFSDINGRHVIRFDDSPRRRQELAQRLMAAGCEVNMSGTDWHTAGDFELE